MSRYIGINHIPGVIYGGIDSSFDGEFKDEEVLVEAGLDYIPCQIGDVREAYDILKKIIKDRKPQDFFELSNIVFETVQRYFGDYSNISERMKNYPDLDDIEDYGKKPGTVANLKGKNSAMCVERAMLTQNLLNVLGIHSFYKASGIKKDGKNEGHAYNLVENEGKYYVFDTAIPTLVDGIISPIIAEIPKEVFDAISKKESEFGYSISAEHFNPLRNKDVSITYDAGRKDVFEYNGAKQKS